MGVYRGIEIGNHRTSFYFKIFLCMDGMMWIVGEIVKHGVCFFFKFFLCMDVMMYRVIEFFNHFREVQEPFHWFLPLKSVLKALSWFMEQAKSTPKKGTPG